MCWEKKINFVFLLARWWKKLVRILLCILRKHVLIFSFNERSENVCVFSSLLSLFGDRVEFFFCLNRTAEKRLHFRDLSVANDENNKKLKSWIVGKSASRKNYWVNFISLHCENQWSKISGFRAEKINFFVLCDDCLKIICWTWLIQSNWGWIKYL
jgi:hypothetical protein